MATTAARSAPSFQFAASVDVMDLQSDNGLDLGQGDSDIDVRSIGQQDDDVSLYDAGTDAGLDAQRASDDRDDFMADHDDFLDEPVEYVQDATDVEVDRQLIVQVSEQSPIENTEEDLINYTDDEEQSAWNEDSYVSTTANPREQQEQTSASDAANQPVMIETDAPTSLLVEVRQKLQDDEYDTPQIDVSAQVPSQVKDEGAEEQNELWANVYGDANAAGDHALSSEQELEGTRQVVEADQNDVQENIESEIHDEGTTQQQASRVGEEIHLHPVTVNYDGAELWLFKHHDFEDSGDFLVENDSVANEPISSVLEACREALGSDVADHVELGFRLDNFHNIELYQEHSSCAFVSLEHLVRLYLQLHAQDGVTDPESFYITLLFRPRVSALLNELTKAATEGTGHTGLQSAIVAGQTAFNAHTSHNSTERIYDDWVSGEQPMGHGFGVGEEDGDGQAEDEGGEEQHEQEYSEHSNEERVEHHVGNLEPHEGPEIEAQTQDEDATGSATSVDFITLDLVSAEKKASDSVTHSAPQDHEDETDSQVQARHEEDDVIDYSEDEVEEEDAHANQHDAQQSSSSSTTVQGDDAPSVGGFTEAIGGYDHAEHGEVAVLDLQQQGHGNDFHPFETSDGADDGSGEDGNKRDTEDGQDVYEQDAAAVQALDVSAAEDALEADGETANDYDIDDAAGELVDQPTDYPPVEAREDDGSAGGVDDEVDEAGDGLDSDRVALEMETAASAVVEGVTVDDEIDFDYEDGAASPALVAASADADGVAASSSDLLELSPQGQKRTIDEVGDDAETANSLSDAKRPRV